MAAAASALMSVEDMDRSASTPSLRVVIVLAPALGAGLALPPPIPSTPGSSDTSDGAASSSLATVDGGQVSDARGWWCVRRDRRDLKLTVHLLLITLQTSLLTPPMAGAIFYLRAIAPAEITLRDMYRGMTPFILLHFVVLGLVMIFPGLALWLPEVLLGFE